MLRKLRKTQRNAVTWVLCLSLIALPPSLLRGQDLRPGEGSKILLETDFRCPWNVFPNGEIEPSPEDLHFFLEFYDQGLNAQYEALPTNFWGAVKSLTGNGFLNPFPKRKVDGRDPLTHLLATGIEKCIPDDLAELAPEGIEEDNRKAWLLEQLTKPKELSPVRDFKFWQRQQKIFHLKPETKRHYSALQKAAYPLFSITQMHLTIDQNSAVNSAITSVATQMLAGLIIFSVAQEFAGAGLARIKLLNSLPKVREGLAMFFGGILGMNVLEIQSMLRDAYDPNERRTLGKIIIDHEFRIVVISGALVGATFLYGTAEHAAIFRSLPKRIQVEATRIFGNVQALAR